MRICGTFWTLFTVSFDPIFVLEVVYKALETNHPTETKTHPVTLFFARIFPFFDYFSLIFCKNRVWMSNFDRKIEFSGGKWAQICNFDGKIEFSQKMSLFSAKNGLKCVFLIEKLNFPRK